MTVTEYYNALMELWHKIDLFYEIKWSYQIDAEKYKKFLKKEQVFDFLQGLYANLDEVRGRLLGSKPFPSIREAFVEVRREESRKRVMRNPCNSEQITQNSALVVNKRERG